MTEPEETSFTRLELELMQVLWRLGAGTVGEVQEGLAADRGDTAPALAYTTVQTMLNILERKGRLERRRRGRAFVYSARVTEETATGSALRDLVERMFGGSSEDLVMSLLKSRQIDARRIAALTRRLEAEESRSANQQPGQPAKEKR